MATMWATSSAYSSGRPSRRGNGIALASDACASSGSIATMGVANTPGAMVHTRTPSEARSRAAGRVMATTPPLEAA